MPNCPECLREIDRLYAFCLEENKYHIKIDDTGEDLDWGDRVDVVDGSSKKTEFQCPECEAILFLEDDWVHDTPKIVAFLKEPIQRNFPVDTELGTGIKFLTKDQMIEEFKCRPEEVEALWDKGLRLG